MRPPFTKKTWGIDSLIDDRTLMASAVLFLGAIVGIVDPWIGGSTSHASRESLAIIHGFAFFLLVPLMISGRVRLATHLGSLVYLTAFSLHFIRSGDMYQLGLVLLVPVVSTVFAGAAAGLFWLVATSATILLLSLSTSLGYLDPAFSEGYSRPSWREGILLAAVMNVATFPVVMLSLMAKRGRELQRDSDQKLQTLLARFDSVTRSAYPLVLEADSTWNVTSVSRTRNESELLAEPLVGQSLFQQIHQDDRSALPNIDRESPPVVANCEFRIRNGGDYHWVRMTGGTYLDQSDPKWICGLQPIHEEVTHRQELVDIRKQESLSELCGGLAHDFNNLLTVISVYSEMLEESWPAKEIRRAQGEASKLTTALLSVAREHPQQVEILHAHQLLNDMKPVIRGLLQENIQLHWKLDADHDCIRVDPTQFRQCILNLITNARDAIESKLDASRNNGRDQITVQTSLRACGTPVVDHLVIEFRDSGIGMDSPTLQRAIEPFFTTKHRSRGTGLGLSLVNGVVKHVNGFIELRSEQDQGTCVHLGFPVCNVPEVQPKSSVVKVAELPHSFGSVVVLVEDQHQLREALAMHLSSCGFETLAFEDAEQAIDSVDVDKIDLLVTDIVLPGIRGTRLANELRQRRPTLPVIFLSGYADGSLPEINEQTKFLAKPFMPEALIELIDTVVATADAPKKGFPGEEESRSSP